jgi:hypothetical protein
MTNNQIAKMLKCYGPDHEVCYVRWTPSGSTTQTLTEAQGVATVTRTSAGLYVINLGKKYKSVLPVVGYIENDTTNYHFARCESSSASAGTITVGHTTVAFASVASGPAASDTVDELFCLAICRKFS